MLKVGDVLSRDVCTISPDDMLSDVATLMSGKQISCVVAIRDKKPVGILTEADLVHIGRMNVDVRVTPADGFLSRQLLSTTIDKNLYEVYDILLEYRVRHLLVLDASGMLQGVITFSDLLKATEFDDYLKAKPIGEAMSRNIITTSPDETLLQALAIMDEKHISCLVAVEHGKAVGVFTERDAARVLASCDDLSGLVLGNVMSRGLVTMHESDSLLEASHRMSQQHFRRMVVVDDDFVPVGILTQFDVVHGLEGKRIQHLKQQFAITDAALGETRRLLAEKAELERRYRSLFDEARDMMHIFDSEGRIIAVNQAELKLLGYSREELIGKPVSDMISQEYREIVIDRLGRLIAGESLGPVELVLLTKSGERVAVESTATPQFEAGKVVAGRSVMRDIRDRKQAEERLQLARFALDHAPDAIYWMEPDGRFVYVNDAACETLGYTREELLLRGVKDIDPCLPEGIPAEMAQRTRDLGSQRFETIHRTKDGRNIPVEIVVSCIMHAGREYHCSFARDISEARRSATRLRRILDANFDAVIVHQDMRVVFSNRAAQAMFGFSCLEETIGLNPQDFMDPRFKSLAAAVARKVIRTGRPSSLTELGGVHQGNREIFPMEIASAPITWEDSPAVVSVVRDISERKAAEQSLKDSEQRLRAIVSASPVPMVITRIADGRVLFSNFEARKMFGILNEQEASEVFSPDTYAQPEARAAVIAQLSVTGEFEGEMQMRRLHGDSFWALLSARTMQFADEQALISILVDTTSQRLLEEQFRQAQKMESVGTLVGGIAHDFNNMLAGMLGQLYLVRYALLEGEFDAANVGRMVERINAVDRQGRLAADVIAQLMTFARKGQVVMERLDLSRLVADVMRLHRVSIPENIMIRIHLGEALDVEGDAGMIQQMLLNLLTNARDALENQPDPYIDIGLSLLVPDAAFLKQHAAFQAGAYARLEVRDNGCGISQGLISRIFDPFFTTKPVGKGTGLGLAMLYGAMQTHHGHVLVESRPGECTCFSLFFPLLRRGGEAVGEEAQVLVQGRGQTILLADDETVLIDVIEQALQLIGYRVLSASNGDEAVRCFQDNRDHIALAILDVVMPVKGGVEAATEMRQIVPDLPVIFHTGYGTEAKLDAVHQWKLCRILKKPVSVEQLSRSIAELLV